MPEDIRGHQDILDKLPDDFVTKSQEFVTNVFRVLTERTQQMAIDMSKFAQDRTETKERIRRGARRTTGRVI